MLFRSPLLLPQASLLFGLRLQTDGLGFTGIGPGWVLWSQLIFVFPYVYLCLHGPYRQFDERLTRAALTLGASPWGAWWRVKGPLLARPLLFAFGVGAAVSLAQYLPTLLFGGGRVVTITTEAVAIGSGGPFGAEGPIIATGGALGSLIGQLLHVTADERKVLLASGAAAGMAAVFSAPVAAVLLAVELLLFERRARSLIPVALAAVAGTALRYVLEGNEPMFPMPTVAAPGFPAIGTYVVLGLILGVVSVAITRLTYAIEDGFAKLPIHWMWWPALGGLVVGCVGYVMPMTLGVGYGNITAVISGQLGLGAMLALCLLKLLSWSVALGSGTSGGTLAPLFTIGGALGGALGIALAHAAPWLGVDPRIIARIEPYVSLLPERTMVNLNTASAEVISPAWSFSMTAICVSASSMAISRIRKPQALPFSPSRQ